MRLPYEFSLSHHQLLFNVFIIICKANMEILLTKNKVYHFFTMNGYFNNEFLSFANTL